MTNEEIKIDVESGRFYAEKWLSLRSLLHAHRYFEYGDDQFYDRLTDAIRSKREKIKKVIDAGKAKGRKHATKLAKRREVVFQ